MHLPEGLPRELVVSGPGFNGIAGIKTSVIAGFVFLGSFYTRDQAARVIGLRKH